MQESLVCVPCTQRDSGSSQDGYVTSIHAATRHVTYSYVTSDQVRPDEVDQKAPHVLKSGLRGTTRRTPPECSKKICSAPKYTNHIDWSCSAIDNAGQLRLRSFLSSSIFVVDFKAQSQTYIPQIAPCVAKLMPLGAWRESDDLAFTHIYQELAQEDNPLCVFFVRKGARLQRGVRTRSCSALCHITHMAHQIRSQTPHHKSSRLL